MGKKGNWFSTIKRVFTSHSKEKLGNESEKRSSKEKKKGLGNLKRGETNSFIPLFKEPSSIEKILGDAEREQQKISYRPPTPPELPKTSPFVSPRVSSPRGPSPRVASPRVASPTAASPKVVHHRNEIRYRPEPTLRNHNASATKIQAAYRGYMARRSFRALRGLVRLQGVVRGQNVKRQTMNAMKQMQLLVRVQTQIHSRRMQMLENQARRQAQYKNDKEMESTFGKWSQASESGNHEDWDDSVLTKEEIEGRLQRKVEAVVKRERAMAYAYSHQLWKGTPKSSQAGLMNIRSGGFPWWWNWLERQLPLANPSPETPVIKKFQPTPPRQITERKPSPQPESSNHKNQQLGFDNIDAATPKSSRSTVPASAKQPRTPSSARIPPANSPRLSKYFKAKYRNADSPFNLSLKDDDSLTSCPPFSVPSYMAPTVSAKAKVRPNSYHPNERFPGTPSSSDSKRRVSFPLTQGVGSFKWNKGSSQMMLDKNQSLQSIGNLSVDSTVSLPAGIGRKPFNRFV